MAGPEILRVFNNNVVLARDASGCEVVLTGRGLGFQARPGQRVDPSKVVRTFFPAGIPDQEAFAGVLADIPPEHVDLAATALERAGVDNAGSRAGKSFGSLIVALADHLSFALKRHRSGVILEYPFRGEVAHLYPAEYAAAQRVLAVVNAALAEPLPEAEAVAIALHLVNASFAAADLTATQQMTELLQQVFEVVESHYDRRFDLLGVNATRFVTHLRYFFVRARADRQLDGGHDTLGPAVRTAYPDALVCANRIRSVLELRLGHPLTDDETTYLTLHVARLATEDRREP